MMLYSALDSTNPIESILDRHIVAVSAGALEAQAAAATTGNPKALDVYLRHAEKMTRTLISTLLRRVNAAVIRSRSWSETLRSRLVAKQSLARGAQTTISL
jgi:hypothetical protein